MRRPLFFKSPALTSLNGSNTMPDILSAAVRAGAGPRAGAVWRAGAAGLRGVLLFHA